MRIPAALRTPWTIVELFAIVNLGFLALDVYIAHSVNQFERAPEWIPVIFSLAAPVVLIVAAILGGIVPNRDYPLPSPAPRARAARFLGLLVGWISLGVGVAGMVFHLQSHFFSEQTIRNLVYTAPFVAPLAYAGIGLLLILDRMAEHDSGEWAQWVVFLALGGFAGNFILSLADHAQNGFYNREEWIPVISSAIAIAFLLTFLLQPYDRTLLIASSWIIAAQGLVGVAGFLLHVRADWYRPGTNVWERYLYGAPLFAPLLFANLALLAAIGMWAMWRAGLRDSGFEIRDSQDRELDSV